MFGSTTTQCLFPDLFGKRLVACFDVDHGSSDGASLHDAMIVQCGG